MRVRQGGAKGTCRRGTRLGRASVVGQGSRNTVRLFDGRHAWEMDVGQGDLLAIQRFFRGSAGRGSCMLGREGEEIDRLGLAGPRLRIRLLPSSGRENQNLPEGGTRDWSITRLTTVNPTNCRSESLAVLRSMRPPALAESGRRSRHERESAFANARMKAHLLVPSSGCQGGRSPVEHAPSAAVLQLAHVSLQLFTGPDHTATSSEWVTGGSGPGKSPRPSGTADFMCCLLRSVSRRARRRTYSAAYRF